MESVADKFILWQNSSSRFGTTRIQLQVQTQCPGCETEFLVSDDQLRVANGKVRCSKCYKVFNALESLEKRSQAKDTPTSDEPPKELPKTVTDFMSEDNLEEFEDLKAKVVDDPKPQQKDKEKPSPEPESKTEDDLSDVLKELERIQNRSKDGSKPQEEDKANPPFSEDNKSTADDPLEILTPKKQPKKRGGLWWSIGILLLLSIGLAQLAWFKREELMHYPEGRSLLQTACKYVGCTLPLVSEPEKIQVLSRSITVHPEIKNALLIQLTIANKASFPQPQPLLQISLFNSEEMLVVQRRFEPNEYLDDNAKSGPFLPGKAIYVELAIEDPGDDVTGFKLDFF